MKIIKSIFVLSFLWTFTFAQQGSFNTATGVHALSINDTGHSNTANGFDALRDNTTGYQNVAVGVNALLANTSGWANTAVGLSALRSNTTGRSNVAMGASSLPENTIGRQNVAVGAVSLFRNTSGSHNVSLGASTLRDNTTGSSNIAVGYLALLQNTEGLNNIAVGRSALSTNQTGRFNVAVGSNVLQVATVSEVTAVGHQALTRATTGANNTAVGAYAMANITTGQSNTGVGRSALGANITGNENTALGQSAGMPTGVTNLNNTTALGFQATVTASNQVRVGNANVTSIGGQVSWTTLSDKRFKSDVKNIDDGLDFINKLRPVIYTVDNNKLDAFLGKTPENRSAASGQKAARTTGFIAQEVEQALEESGAQYSLVDKPDNAKDYYGIRYAAFVVPLVKSVQELSTLLEEQQAIIEQQQKQIDALLQNRTPQTDFENNYSETKRNDIVLHQNQPNPYSLETQIKVELPEDIKAAELLLFDLRGKQLKSIPIMDRGASKVRIPAASLDAGMYVYTLMVDGRIIDSKQMVLVK